MLNNLNSTELLGAAAMFGGLGAYVTWTEPIIGCPLLLVASGCFILGKNKRWKEFGLWDRLQQDHYNFDFAGEQEALNTPPMRVIDFYRSRDLPFYLSPLTRTICYAQQIGVKGPEELTSLEAFIEAEIPIRAISAQSTERQHCPLQPRYGDVSGNTRFLWPLLGDARPVLDDVVASLSRCLH